MGIPFKKYIYYLIYAGKKIQYISDDLKKKHFFIRPDDVNAIYKDILETSSDAIVEKLKDGIPLDPEVKSDMEILEFNGILELYKYSIYGLKRRGDQPDYIKWFDDIEWIMQYEDVITIINLFIFNREELSNISSVIQFKYHKKISVDALSLYKSIYWDTSSISSKEAVLSCIPLRNSSYIVKRLEDGSAEVTHAASTMPESDNGFVGDISIMDSKYIKWKIGYKEDIKVPTTKSFMEDVKMDSYMKYKEALYMAKSIEASTDNGEGPEGPINVTRIKRKNVESERMRLMKGYLDMFIRADEKMPDETTEEEANFFNNLQQVNMRFIDDDKIMDAKEVENLLDDIAGDM